MKLLVTVVTMLACAGALAAQAPAAEFPNRPLRIIDAFPPGGGTDFAARVIAQKLTQELGQQVVVENRAGAAGNIGTAAVARATPDGHTMGMANNATLTINPSIYKQLPYDPIRDFAPVTLVAAYPYFITVRPTLPVKSLQDLVALAKAQPGKLNYASAGSTTRVVGALFKTVAGMQITDVPFNGTGPAVTALLGGHVDFMLASSPLGQIKTGALRALAVTGPKRSAAMPELPTVAEAGLPGLQTLAWLAIVTPAGVPQPILNRLHKALVGTIQQQDVRERFATTGLEVVGSSPAELTRVINADLKQWARVTKEAGIEPQ